MGKISVSCYLAKLEEYKKRYPLAHFEIITNTNYLKTEERTSLAPTDELLIKSGIYTKSDGTFNKKLPFTEYAKLFVKEINNNPKALQRIQELREIANQQDIFLVCVEQDASQCHRSIIKNIILKKPNPEIVQKINKSIMEFF